jgi:hypothetical protein
MGRSGARRQKFKFYDIEQRFYSILPIDLLTLSISAAIIRNADLVDPQCARPCDIGRELDFKSKVVAPES